MKRMFPLMENDSDTGMTPGGDLMREVDWCRQAMGGVSTELVPDRVVAPVKEGRSMPGSPEFDVVEGTRTVVEALIAYLEDMLEQAKDSLSEPELVAAQDAYENDIKLLKSIVRKLSVV